MLYLYSQTCQQLLICVFIFIHVQFWAEIDFFGPSLVGYPWKLVCWGSRQTSGEGYCPANFLLNLLPPLSSLISWGSCQPFLTCLPSLQLFRFLFLCLRRMFPSLSSWSTCSCHPHHVLSFPPMVLQELLHCPLGVSAQAACSAPIGHQQCVSRQTKLEPVCWWGHNGRRSPPVWSHPTPSSVFNLISSQDFLASAITTWTWCQLSGVVF